MLDYLRPDCRLTLREAIDQLRLEDAKDRDVAPAVAPDVERSMTAHDAVHVIFACDTSDRGEAIAHAWMLLGTDVSRAEIHRVMTTQDHRRFAREVGHWRRALAVAAAFPAIALAMLRARHMLRRWGWHDYHEYLGTPLTDIRSRYGIRVPSPRR